MPGNSASGNVYCANSSAYPYSMSVSWSESSPSVANNTSVISASGSMGGQYVSFAAGSYAYYLRLYWHDNRTNSDTHFASSGAFNSMGMGYGSRSVSGSITVTHKDDGSLSGYVFMRFESPSTSGGWAPVTTDLATGNTALTTIARASSFTINAGSALLGSPVSITIDRKSSSFTHRVSYQFAGSSSTTVTTSAATSASFTPPISLASQIPNATTGVLTISVSTWNGGTQIGSAVNKSVNLGVPTSVVPTMGTPTVTRVDTGVPSSWGVYVKGFSRCTVSIVSAAGIHGSTIKSYSITGGGLNASTSEAVTGPLNTAGTVTFTCKITDSRGRTAEKTVSITVVDYSGPSLSVSAERCSSGGTISAEGTYLRVTVDYSFASVSGKNSIASKSVTCNGATNTTFGDGSPFTLAANVSIGSTYVLTAKVTDALGQSFSASIDIRTATRVLNVRATKDGLAIGKFSEKTGFEVGWPAFFDFDAIFYRSIQAAVASINGNLTVGGTANFKSRMVDAFNTRITNGLTMYESAGIDPNTTLENLILTNHSNRPSSVSAYWYITTMFYSTKSTTANRAQVAYPYSTKASVYHRLYHDGSWTAWRRLVNEDDLTPQEYRFQFKPFVTLSNNNSFTLVVHKVQRMCFVILRWIGNCNVSYATFNEITIPAGYRPLLSNIYATTKNVSGTTDYGSTRYQIGSDGRVTFHTDNQGFLERFACCSYISDS